MSSETQLLYNRITVTDREAFKHYRENAKHRNLDDIYTLSDFSKVVRLFYKKIGEHLVENPNGVFLDKFGYFTILMNPIKTTVKMKRHWSKKELFLNPHTEGRVFHPIFIPISTNFFFRLFTLDKTFNRDLKVKLKDKLRAKFKYMNHFGILNSLHKNKR